MLNLAKIRQIKMNIYKFILHFFFTISSEGSINTPFSGNYFMVEALKG